ncbi:MAG: hypothetical protein AAFO29_16950, partial [Actinomycetota bacterium]
MGFLDGRRNRKAPGDRSYDEAVDWSPVELSRPDRLDPFLTDRELRAGFRVLVDGDWRRLERFLDVSSKSWMFGPIVTGEIVGMETVVFERWVDFERSPQSRVFLANAMIRDAFVEYHLGQSADASSVTGGAFPLSGPPATDDPTSTNGSGPAGDLDDFDLDLALDTAESAIDQWLTNEEDDRFVTQLSAAEELLYEVISERPAMAEPWVGLLISGRALQVDLDELRERFENAHSRDPFRPDACIQYLQGLTKKWGGSNVASFDLARWLEDEA